MLAGALLGGFFWLIRTDGAESATVRVASIPPRIADSIERKKVVVPPQAPQVTSVTAASMRESNVSLGQPVAAKWFIRELAPPRARKRDVRSRSRVPADTTAATSFYSAPTTARSDNFSGL